jgi:hypothetical protein
MQSVIQPKMPINAAWVENGQLKSYYANRAFIHRPLRLQVISAVEVPEGEPEYHLTVSKIGKHGPERCSKQEGLLALKHFGLEGALEDNHSSTIRSYWLPVAEINIGKECACKATETVIKEGDFEWRPLSK